MKSKTLLFNFHSRKLFSKTLTLLLFFTVLSVTKTQAQNLAWAKAMGGTIADISRSVAVDAAGNVYTTGYFQGTVDFDPNAGVSNITTAGSDDIFVTKLDATGNLVWAKTMGGTGGDHGYGISVDAAGNVYTTGYFIGTADFDPNAGVSNLTSAGVTNIFVSKLDTNGNLVWAKAMGSTTGDLGFGISVDAAGNVYTTGYFQGTVDFDPNAGVSNLTSVGGGNDIFVSKLDATGNFVWAKAIGDISVDSGNGITVDAAGNVYTTGYFQGTVDFDPNAGVSNLTSAGGQDIFVSKLDATGNFVWAKAMGSNSVDSGNGIVIDASGNVYITGSFIGTADFDPNAGVSNITAAGSFDIFVSKLDATGNLVWAKAMGGTSSDIGNSIAVDASGNVYTTGSFATTADFNPNAGVSNLTAAGGSDIFVSKLNATGNLVWAKAMGGTSADTAYGINTDTAGNVYTTGSFVGTADFDPNAGVSNLTSLGSQDIFVHKMSQVQGAALHFDGTNDNATVANVPALQFGTNNLTFEAKIKLSGAQGNFAGIITKATTATNQGIQLVCVSNKLALEIGDGTTNFGTGNGLIGTTNLNDGAWHHVAVVVHRATNTINLYVDGISEVNYTNSAIATLDLSTTTSLFIGKERTSGIYFNGTIDEARIWNRDLSQCEIQNNMNGELPSGQTGLLAYYQFNQGLAAGNNATITSLTDSSGNNYNGILTSFALNGATSNWVSPGGVTTGVTSPVYNSLTVAATQTFNSPATVANLTATGTSIKWYDVAIGGTALVSTTTLVTGTYYVTQTTGTCESLRTAVQVNIIGSALHFDGANDKVVVGNAMNAVLDPLNKITVEAWVKPTNTTFNGVIVGNYLSPNNEMQFLLRRDFDQFALWVNDGTGFKVVNSGVGTVTLNTWQHVAGVWDGSSLYIYIDGVLKATTTGVTGSSFATTNNDVVLGSDAYSTPESFTGSVDEVRIWTRAVSQCEIQNNMNGELPAGQTGLLAYYQFNQGIASGNNAGVTSLTDSSGNNYNGTLTNFALNGATSNWVSPGGLITGAASPVYNPITVTAVANQASCNNDVRTPIVFSSSTTGSICATTAENGSITLTAPAGAVFTSIPFASYGTPNGSCGSFTVGSCHAANSISVVSGLAVGQNNVTIPATNGLFGDPCAFTGKRLYVEAVYNNTVFNWTNDTPSIGLAANGTGNIPSFTAVNSGSTPIIATITVTPTTNGCVGTPIQFTITVNPTPVAPTAASQNFCDSATVSDLVATGTSLQWYANASGGTVLASTTALTTATYYVSQTTATCESPRTAVTVTINTTAAPTATTPQIFNTGTTVANLVATGTALNWYSVPTGGVALVNTTPLTTGLYYVSQTISGCESLIRTPVQVNINGTALDFDGSNDYVTCGNIMPSTYTKEAWFYITNFSLENNLISGGFDGQHALYPSATQGHKISAGHNGGWTAVQDPTPIVTNTWYHVALTYDAATTTMKLYTNGVLVSTNTNVQPFNGGNALRIGSYDDAQNLLGGKIDEVRVWNRVLPQAEIQNNMNCELGPGQTGLVAYYKFNQGFDSTNNSSITTLTDSSGNTNTGTLNNFSLTGATSNWVANGAVTTGNTCPTYLSSSDFEFSSKFSVYPNPSSDVFSINSDSRATIVVYDLMGKIIKSENLDLGITKLDLSNYSSGIYLMKVTNDANQTKTMKLIKQ